VRTYDAGVRVTVTLTYYVVLEAEADSPKDAEDRIRHQALGLTRPELEALCDGRSSNTYEGSETTVLEVGQVGPPGWAPEDGPMELYPEGDVGEDPREEATPGR